MQEASEGRLKLFEVDLLKEGSFAEAIKGCEYVIHTASPFLIGKVSDPQKELIQPALKGVQNVFNEVNQQGGVKRIVLTSSVVAIMKDGIEAKEVPHNTLDEKYWNESASESYMPYAYSKTVAEREAWKIAGSQSEWDLVVINPGFILGPTLSERMDGVSVNFMKTLTDGTMSAGVPGFYTSIVDVRNVSEAHIRAAFMPEAEGRHILSSEVSTFVDYGHVLQEEFGDAYSLPKRILPKWLAWLLGPAFGLNRKNIARSANMPFKLDNSKSKEALGIEYIDKKETLTDQLRQMKEKGML